MYLKREEFDLDSEKIIKAKGILKFDEHFDKKLESIGIYFFQILILCVIPFVIMCFIRGSIRSVVDYILNDWIKLLVTINLGSLLLLKIWMYRRKKIFKNSNIRKEHIYTINGDGITREIEKNLVFIKWSNISKVVEKYNIFIVYIVYNNKQPTFIPKSFFSNECENIDAFERINPLYVPKRFFGDESSIIDFKEILKENNIKFN